ncbi:MAG: glycosyltransferase [Clostridiales bacterium]|nr:glycosyltransferase [Clostridiales bacterium]
MKKRILIVSHALELGGAERSLIGLLDALDPAQCTVDLFLLRHEGELMNEIPPHVNLLPSVPSYTVLARPMITTLLEGHLLLTAARLFGKISAHFYDKRHDYSDSIVSLEYSHKFTCPFMPGIQPNTVYDLAVSFLTPHYFAANKVNANKKIAWIHTDYSKVHVNIDSELKMWDAYDHIVSISTAVTENFLSVFPSLKEKLILIENILPGKLIAKQANVFIPPEMSDSDHIRLLSIGRFCTAKNFDNIPDICSRLVESGLNVKWYIIGYGGDEQLIRRKIGLSGMENRVVMLGKKTNPYPYIKNCDLYIQPSRYEGKCVTVREAQMLGKPVVITRYATSSGQLEDGLDGIIVPMDNEGCATGIANLLRNPARMERLSQTCKSRDYSNRQEVEKLYLMMG